MTKTYSAKMFLGDVTILFLNLIFFGIFLPYLISQPSDSAVLLGFAAAAFAVIGDFKFLNWRFK